MVVQDTRRILWCNPSSARRDGPKSPQACPLCALRDVLRHEIAPNHGPTRVKGVAEPLLNIERGHSVDRPAVIGFEESRLKSSSCAARIDDYHMGGPEHGGIRQDEAVIQQEFGENLSWERLDERRASRIAVYRDGSIDNGEELPEIRKWAIERLLKFKKVFDSGLQKVANP